MRTKPTAFTLLEISVVLVIVSLLTTTVAVSITGRHARISKETWLTQFKHWESQARQQARRSHTAYQLVVHTNTSSCRFVNEQTQQPVGVTLEFPRRLSLQAVRLQGQPDETGQMAIPYSAKGYTPTYAFKINHEKTSFWLIVTGITGQVIETDSESTVDAIMASLQ